MAIYETRPRAGRESYPITDAAVLTEGMLVCLIGGYLAEWDTGTAGEFLGLLIGGDDRAHDGVLTGETADAPPPVGRVNENGDTIVGVTVTGSLVTSPGALVYAATSDAALYVLVAGGAPVGRLTKWRAADDCDVQLFTPTEALTA